LRHDSASSWLWEGAAASSESLRLTLLEVVTLSLSYETRLAKPPSGTRLDPSVASLRVLPWRTLIRTAVLKPLGNFSRSRMITWRRLSTPVSSLPCTSSLVRYGVHNKREKNSQRNSKHNPKVTKPQRPDNQLPQAEVNGPLLLWFEQVAHGRQLCVIIPQSISIILLPN